MRRDQRDSERVVLDPLSNFNCYDRKVTVVVNFGELCRNLAPHAFSLTNPAVCTFNTSPCVPATRPHVLMYTDAFLNLHTDFFERDTPHTTPHTTTPKHSHSHSQQHRRHTRVGKSSVKEKPQVTDVSESLCFWRGVCGLTKRPKRD